MEETCFQRISKQTLPGNISTNILAFLLLLSSLHLCQELPLDFSKTAISYLMGWFCRACSSLVGEETCFPRISRQKTPWKSTNVSFFSFFLCGGPCFTFATRFPQLSKTISYLKLMIILHSNYTTKISAGLSHMKCKATHSTIY